MHRALSNLRSLASAVPATALASVLALTSGPAAAAADEISELKAALATLQQRLEQLESQSKTVEETNDKQTDQIAMVKANVGSWVPNFTFKGDLRYRNENIDQEYSAERNRDRIRMRTGFVAKVNDTIRTEVGISTSEGNDPRSSNQTLTDGNSRKNLFVDLAYAEWQPRADLKFTAGKMKYPWVRAGQSVFFDGDVNPEGLAFNFTRGDFFASTFYNILEERSAAGESTMTGAQFGWKPMVGAGRLTLGASYFDAHSVQNRTPAFSAANGNTTKNTGCFGGGTGCLANDYNLLELFAEWALPAVAGKPLTIYVDYVKNDKAINSLDTAYSSGLLWGKASDPRTWEIGYFYANVEKDALYGEYIDSDWGAGNTDAKGHTFKFAYAFAKNWTLNTTYILNKTNMDVATTVAGVGSVFDRDYKRLQIDLNFKY